MKRNIIKIDRSKCNGCGECITGCPEGAIRLIKGKAMLVSENYCDGLGACTGNCPEGAITIEERDALPYNESLVIENMISQGSDAVRAHLLHLLEHGEMELYSKAVDILKSKGIALPHETPLGSGGHSCPGSISLVPAKPGKPVKPATGAPRRSRLNQWPVKLKLISPSAALFSGEVDLLVSADCAPYAEGDFHEDFLNGRIMVTFCPKLDPYIDEYREKLAEIFAGHDIKSVTIARMEVPCCGGVTSLVRGALSKSGKNIPVDERIIKILQD